MRRFSEVERLSFFLAGSNPLNKLSFFVWYFAKQFQNKNRLDIFIKQRSRNAMCSLG